MKAATAPSDPSHRRSNLMRRLAGHRRRAWWAAWIIASGCLVVFACTHDWRTTAAQLANAKPGWIVVAVVGHFITLPLLTEQWHRLQPRGARLSRGALWECVTIGMASMNTLPFGGGHAIAVGLLSSRGASLEGAISLLVLEQLCDGVAKFALLLFAVAVVPLPATPHHVTWIMAAALGLGFLGLVWLARHPDQSHWSARWRSRWVAHLEPVRQPGVLVVAIGLSLAGKAGALLAVYAGQRSLGVELPLASVPLVLAAVTFSTLMALSPGSLGVFEVAAVAAYRLMGVAPGAAAALAILQHGCFLLPNLATGYAVMGWRAVASGRAKPGRGSARSAIRTEAPGLVTPPEPPAKR